MSSIKKYIIACGQITLLTILLLKHFFLDNYFKYKIKLVNLCYLGCDDMQLGQLIVSIIEAVTQVGILNKS